MSIWNDILGVVGVGQDVASSGASAGGNDPGFSAATVDGGSGLDGPLKAIATAAYSVTDGYMWRSVGWIFLGVVLMGVALLLLAGESKTIQSGVGTVVGAAAKAP